MNSEKEVTIEEKSFNEFKEALKKTFKIKIDQKLWMFNFTGVLENIDRANSDLRIAKARMEALFDLVGINQLEKDKWFDKFAKGTKDEARFKAWSKDYDKGK